jgi:hypothetical protein
MKQITTTQLKQMVKEELKRQLVKEATIYDFNRFWQRIIPDIHIKTAKIGNWFTRLPEKMMFEPEVHMHDIETIIKDKRYNFISDALKKDIINLTRNIWYEEFPAFVKSKYKMTILDVMDKAFDGKMSATKIWQDYLESKKNDYKNLFLSIKESKKQLKEGKFTADRLLGLLYKYRTKSGELFANSCQYGFRAEDLDPETETVWGSDADGGEKEIATKDVEFITINGKRIS